MNPISGYSPSPQMNTQRSGGYITFNKQLMPSIGQEISEEAVVLSSEEVKRAKNVLNRLEGFIGLENTQGLLLHALQPDKKVILAITDYPGLQDEPKIGFYKQVGSSFRELVQNLPISQVAEYIGNETDADRFYKHSYEK
jgi:hypothetical protein